MKKHYVLILILILFPKICTIYAMNNSKSTEDAKNCLLQLPISDELRNNFIIENNKRIKAHDIQELLDVHKNLNAVDDKGFVIIPDEVKTQIWKDIYGNEYTIEENPNTARQTYDSPEINEVIDTIFGTQEEAPTIDIIGPNDKGDMFVQCYVNNQTKGYYLNQAKKLKNDLLLNPGCYYTMPDLHTLHKQEPMAIATKDIHSQAMYNENKTSLIFPVDIYMYRYQNSAVAVTLFKTVHARHYIHPRTNLLKDLLDIQFGQHETIWIHTGVDNTIEQYDYKGNLLSTVTPPIPQNTLKKAYPHTGYSVNPTNNLILVFASHIGRFEYADNTDCPKYQYFLLDDRGNHLKTFTGIPDILGFYEPIRPACGEYNIAPLILKVKNPTVEQVNTDLNYTMLTRVTKKLLEQEKPDKQRCKEVIDRLKSDPQKYLIISTAQKQYNNNIFKALHEKAKEPQTAIDWKSCLIS